MAAVRRAAVFAAISRTDALGDRRERRFEQIEVRLGRIEVALGDLDRRVSGAGA